MALDVEATAMAALVGRRRRPALEPGHRRGQIIAAATTVLSRQGYGDTSLKEIAREAGVAPGLLHYYFESKEQLLLEVVEEMDRELTSTWQVAVRDIEDPLERIVAALDAAEARCSERPESWRLLFDVYMLGLSNPAVHRRCQVLRGRLIAAIEAEIRQVLGTLPAYSLVPPGELAAAIAGALDGISLGALIEDGGATGHFRALKVLVLSLVVTAHVTAGQEPPVQHLSELLNRPAGHVPR